MEDHNKGKVFSTARYLPWKILYYEAYISEKSARIREKRLKYNGNALRELKGRIGLLPFKLKSGAGFTIIEFMIVIALIIMFSSLTLPMGFNFYQKSTLKDQARNLENSLRRAQAMAMAGRGDSNAGVKIIQEEQKYIIFEGESYDERRKETDIIIPLPIALSVSGANEIIFQKSTGLPTFLEEETSTIITFGASSQEITINSQGKIERHEKTGQ